MSAGSEDDLRAAWEPAPDVQRCPWAGRRKPSLAAPGLVQQRRHSQLNREPVVEAPVSSIAVEWRRLVSSVHHLM